MVRVARTRHSNQVDRSGNFITFETILEQKKKKLSKKIRIQL